MKKNIIIFIALIVLSFPAINSLIQSGLYTSHDLTYHIVRIVDMDRILSEGQFPPRWSGDLNLGYGYPLFLFNYPTPAIFGVLFHKVGFSYVDSVKVVLIFFTICGVVGMYLFLNNLFVRNKMASIAGSLLYLYAPITFVNLYVSAEVGTVVAMGILPYVFWSIVVANKNNNLAVPIGACSLCVLITSHNITALLFVPVLVLFSAILIFNSKLKRFLISKIVLIFVLGIGLASFFWMPAILEKKFIIYDTLMNNFWLKRFPDFWEIIYPSWGYGLSSPGEKNSLSHQLGIVHILVILLLPIATYIYRKNKEFVTFAGFCLFIFYMSLYLMLEISTPIWKSLPLLYLVQFPPRLLIVSVFSISVAAALMVEYLPYKNILSTLLVVCVIWASWNYLGVNERIVGKDSDYMAINDTTTAFNEHRPKLSYVPGDKSIGKITILEGSGNVQTIEDKSTEVTAKLILYRDSIVQFNQFYFPGWKYEIDSNLIIPTDASLVHYRGLPVFNIKEGEHIFKALFTDTKDRVLANTTSIISFFLLVAYMVKTLIPKNKFIIKKY